MRRMLLVAVFMLIATISSNLYADENNSETSFGYYAIALLGGEAVIALNASWASVSPKSFGLVTGVLTPIAFEKGLEEKNYGAWSIVVAMESLSIYNLTANENNKQKMKYIKQTL